MKIPVTFFAPAKREPLKVVHRQAGSFDQTHVARTLRDATQNYLFVLNSRRQIVMASENILELVPGKTMEQIIGLRLGEALGCINAHECEGGCGTSRFCRQCRALRVILIGLEGHRAIEECHLQRSREGKMEFLHLEVLATPLVHDREHYSLLTMADIKNTNR